MANEDCIAPKTCDLLDKLREKPWAWSKQRAAPREFDGSSGDAERGGQMTHRVHQPFSAAGYYMLRPGTRLQTHAGPTNERLTCHLTLRGEGAWFTVGEEKAREWRPGSAFCFDDSFVHSAVHLGTEDRFVLLVDVPHPELIHSPS